MSIQSPKPNLWDRLSATQEDTSTFAVAALRFCAAHEGERLTTSKNLLVCSNILHIADEVAKACKGDLVTPYSYEIFVEGSIEGQPILARVSRDRNSSNNPGAYDDDDEDDDTSYLFRDRVARFAIDVTGHRAAIEAIFRHLDSVFSSEHFANVRWWYVGEHGVTHKNIYLPPVKTKLHPEFYPDIEGGPSRFIQDYLAADESILLMAGPPGTGKTTFLRHMIVENKLSAHVCYDETLMKNDKVFQTFLMESDSDMMVIEDADTILISRERDGNKMMARFLNVSDGLIKLPNKKLVFTTNLTDFSKVDSALLRPGRCFAVLHTRALDLKESQEASSVGGFPTPAERKQYTLAELFNQGKTRAGVRRIGFNAG